jgi:CheY-like chemotaxis protein
MIDTLDTPQRPYRLLVVDDSRAMQVIICRVLESSALGPMELRKAVNGEEALALVPEFAPDMIIADWHMPRMSGIEMLQTLRQTGSADLAVGFVTTETSASQLQQAHNSGASFILHKPFDDKALVKAVLEVQRKQAEAATATTAASAASEPAPSPPASRISAAGQALQQLIKRQMPRVPLRIIEGDTFGLGQLTQRNLLALYTGEQGPAVVALAAANMPALCMLGGGDAHTDPQTVRQAIRDGQPTESMLAGATRFFREAAEILPSQLGVPPSQFKGTNLVGEDFDKLRDAVRDASQRVDYRLTIPGYGDGYLVFIRR